MSLYLGPKGDSEWGWMLELLVTSAQVRHRGRIRLRAKRENEFWTFFWSLANVLLKIVTFGRSVNLVDGPLFTLLGRTIWVPGDGSMWDEMSDFKRYMLFSHELDHLDWVYFRDHDARDNVLYDLKEVSWFKRMLHHIKYLVWPFPFLWADYRQYVEYHGYLRNVVALYQYYGELPEDVEQLWRGILYNIFVGSDYAWMATSEKAKKLVDQIFKDAKELVENEKFIHVFDKIRDISKNVGYDA